MCSKAACARAASACASPAQLVEAATGSHLWADRYDGALDDMFDLQDQITLDVVGAIEPSVQQAEVERARRKRPENLDAYDHFLRALPHAWANHPAEAVKALEHLDAALRIDPDYGDGACLRGVVSARPVRPSDPRSGRPSVGRSITPAPRWRARPTIRRRLPALPLSSRCSIATTPAAQAALNRALAINPDSSLALANVPHRSMPLSADTTRRIEFADKASRSSPLDPLRYRADMGRGLAHLHTGRYADAIAAFQRAVEVAPRFGVARALLAAAYSLRWTHG